MALPFFGILWNRIKGTKKSSKGNSSDELIKFLLIVVIAGIAITMLFFIQSGKGKGGHKLSPTPAPTKELTPAPSKEPDQSPAPTNEPTKTPTTAPTNPPKATDTPAPTPTPSPKATSTPKPTSKPTPTAAPTEAPVVTPVIDILLEDEAEQLIGMVIPSQYEVRWINENLQLPSGEYYEFCALTPEGNVLYPFLIVDKMTGVIMCYDAVDNTVFDYTEFPMKDPHAETVEPTPGTEKVITKEEAYQVLCSYSKESLNIDKDVSSYNAEYDSVLTLVNGNESCYQIILSEVTANGKVRNRGSFFISLNGQKCYSLNTETGEFILITR